LRAATSARNAVISPAHARAPPPALRPARPARHTTGEHLPPQQDHPTSPLTARKRP